jgi:hypothetical protein
VPALVTVLEPPVMKTPNELPERDAPELLVTLPPPSISAPAAPVARMLPAFVTVAAPPPLEKTPAVPPEMNAPAAFVTLPPAWRAIP